MSDEMPNYSPEHVALVRDGAEAVRRWRVAHPTEKLRLAGAPLAGADLRRMSLKLADLRSADLTEVRMLDTRIRESMFADADLSLARVGRSRLHSSDFSGASFRGASITHSTVRRCVFWRAHLSRASLGMCGFYDTNLAGAQLRLASLVAATFKGCSLAGASLNRAGMGEVSFLSSDVSLAQGLASVDHISSGSIDAATLALAGGRIPDDFLAGLGLSDWEIEASRLYNPNLTQSEWAEITTEMFVARHERAALYFSVFISHSSKERPFAKKLDDALQARGIRVWRDEHQILPGDKIDEKIHEGIKLWDKVLLLISEHSIKSWWVEQEVDRALEKERELRASGYPDARTLIPIILDDSLKDWDHPKGALLRQRGWADFRQWEDDDAFTAEVARLEKALRANDMGRPPPPSSQWK